MKPYLKVKIIWGLSQGIEASQASWAQMPQIMGFDIQKFIQNVKLHIPHQLKSYCGVQAIWGLSYTCFSIFGELGQVGKIGPKYP